MKFYLDFEATDFAEDIISIGCVAETGATFYRVVLPSDYNNITWYIRKLTGLTAKYVIKHGIYPDLAFKEMGKFVERETPASDNPKFYCYGNSDFLFIRNTIKNMRNPSSIVFANTILGSMRDYSCDVQKIAHGKISLKKLITIVRGVDKVEQRHNALEDALMLKELDENFERVKDKIIFEGKRRRIQQEIHNEIQREVGEAKRRARNGIVVGGLDFSRRVLGVEGLRIPSHMLSEENQIIVGGWDRGRRIQWQETILEEENPGSTRNSEANI